MRAYAPAAGSLWLHLAVAERLVERAGPVVQDLDEDLEAIEVEALEGASDVVRPRVAKLHRQAIALRRSVAPERDALASLAGRPGAALAEGERMRIREVAERVTRYVEDLGALRERAAVTSNELATRLADTMNGRMHLLSLLAAVLLPLGLLTGPFGVNGGGFPGTNNEWGFSIVTGIPTGIGGATVWWLRARRMVHATGPRAGRPRSRRWAPGEPLVQGPHRPTGSVRSRSYPYCATTVPSSRNSGVSS